MPETVNKLSKMDPRAILFVGRPVEPRSASGKLLSTILAKGVQGPLTGADTLTIRCVRRQGMACALDEGPLFVARVLRQMDILTKVQVVWPAESDHRVQELLPPETISAFTVTAGRLTERAVRVPADLCMLRPLVHVERSQQPTLASFLQQVWDSHLSEAWPGCTWSEALARLEGAGLTRVDRLFCLAPENPAPLLSAEWVKGIRATGGPDSPYQYPFLAGLLGGAGHHLGSSRGLSLPAPTCRRWPLEGTSICGGPLFEGFVDRSTRAPDLDYDPGRHGQETGPFPPLVPCGLGAFGSPVAVLWL